MQKGIKIAIWVIVAIAAVVAAGYMFGWFGGNKILLSPSTTSLLGSLSLGSSNSYVLGGTTYKITLSSLTSTQAKFTVNGKLTSALNVGTSSVLDSGTTLKVTGIVYKTSWGVTMRTANFVLTNTAASPAPSNITQPSIRIVASNVTTGTTAPSNVSSPSNTTRPSSNATAPSNTSSYSNASTYSY